MPNRAQQHHDAQQAARHAAWEQARVLEAQDRFAEAEALIKQAMPDGWPQQSAHVYELRMHRLIAAGDAAGALDAFKRASDWLYFFASCATSGGEGAAYSLTRDDGIAEMKAALRAAGIEPPDR